MWPDVLPMQAMSSAQRAEDIASDVLVVVATLSAIVPVILRFMVVLYGQDASVYKHWCVFLNIV